MTKRKSVPKKSPKETKDIKTIFLLSTLSEAFGMIEKTINVLISSHEEKQITVDKSYLEHLIFVYIDLFLYFCYIEQLHPDMKENEQKRIAEYQKQTRTHLEELLSIETDLPDRSYASLPPITVDGENEEERIAQLKSAEELITRLKELYGWEYSVNTEPLQPESHKADPQDPNGDKLDSYYKHRDSREYSLPEIEPALARKVKKKLGWNYPTVRK